VLAIASISGTRIVAQPSDDHRVRVSIALAEDGTFTCCAPYRCDTPNAYGDGCAQRPRPRRDVRRPLEAVRRAERSTSGREGRVRPRVGRVQRVRGAALIGVFAASQRRVVDARAE
jgi:hypothetical protein